MRNVSHKEREKLPAEIADLESLDLNQLRVRWKLLYEIEAPPHLSRDWLMRAVAYRIQENVLGGLKPATRRLPTSGQRRSDAQGNQSRAYAEGRAEHNLDPGMGRYAASGHGSQKGVMFRGQRYRSLSHVARLITGSQWSGPLFFGLKAPAKEASNGAR